MKAFCVKSTDLLLTCWTKEKQILPPDDLQTSKLNLNLYGVIPSPSYSQ